MTARYALLGAWVDAMTQDDLRAAIRTAVETREQRVIANHNLHSLHLFHRDPKMRAFFQRADDVHVDGMSVVMLARMLQVPLAREHRMTSLDWTAPVFDDAAAGGWRVFYLGARPGVARAGIAELAGRHAGLVVGQHHGYFEREGAENDAIVDEINRFAPDIVLVGMGMPIQEHWILDNIDRLHASVVIPVGAFIDYVAGAIPKPPRWVGRVGLEWLYRLVSEPRRLWRRYLVEPWFVARLLLGEVLRFQR